jgi:anti-anti-sigma factor
MALKIEVEERGKDRVVVRLVGRLDAESADGCGKELAPLSQGGAKQLVLDLGGLEYISSLGLRVLLSAKKAMAGRHGQLVLANPQPPVKKVLDLAEILPATDIFQSIESADIFLDAIQHKEQVKDMDVDV